MKTSGNDITFSFIVPVRNEPDTLAELCGSLLGEVDKLGEPAEIIFVNDGSADATDAALHQIQIDNDCVRVLELSRPFGFPAAVTAGVAVACGKAAVTFDRRCENWPELLAKLVGNWREGFEIVHAVGRQSTERPKKTRSRVVSLAMGPRREAPCNTADMRLIDCKAVQALRAAGMPQGTIDSRVDELGFRQTTITHEGAAAPERNAPAARSRGEEACGLFCALLTGGSLLLVGALLLALISLVAMLFGVGPADWVWLTMTIVALSGLHLMALSSVGRYVARAATVVDQHPLYIVRDRSGFLEDASSQEPVEESGHSGYVVYT